jgi:predicted ATPase
MASKLLKLQIDGLLERRKPLIVDFNDDYNFFIGQNGTGKTTVINLVAAALLCDFEKLDKINFEKVELALIDHKLVISKIIVTKTKRDEDPYTDIAYTIKTAESETTYDLDSFAIERSVRATPSRMARQRLFRHHFVDARSQVAAIVDVRWLSIHRATDGVEFSPEGKYITAIDRKLQELANDIAKYFGRLSKSYTDRTTDFQQSSLLSVIRSESKFTFERFLKEIDIEAEQSALKDAFEALGMQKYRYEAILRNHFSDLRNAIAAAGGRTQEAYSWDEISSIYNGWKAHNLVSDYKKLEQEKGKIFKPRDTFIATINALFSPRKKVKVSSRNELIVGIQKGDDLTEIELSELSSGEKQLLIILGEALLQESSPVIYIADEPELSLHVRWQERITGSIKAINPNAQIVFATHSPDIVNVHSENVIDMEVV